MESYKYIYEARADFPEVNKTETLEKCHYQNAATYHKQKMIENQSKREKAASRALDIYEAKYYKNKKNLSKWEDYRENKIELTHIFIKVLKRKNFLRRWLIIHKRGQNVFHIFRNLFIRRELNRI